MQKKSFTLIELLVVIAIIGILAGFIIVSMSGASDSANDSRRKADINQLSKAVMIYKTNHPDDVLLIDTDGCNVGNDCSDNTIFGSASVLRDPNGTYYTYTSLDGNDFTITSKLSNDNNYSFDSSTGVYSEVSSNPINGICGTANKIFYATSSDYGANTFCSSGTLSSTPAFPEIGQTVNWTCTGEDGGTNASCSSSRTVSSCIDVVGLDCNEYTVGTDTVNVYTLTGLSTTSTTWTVPAGVTEVEYLVVGGGGGGAMQSIGNQGGSGGGGAGGLLTANNYDVSGSINIIVGSGGNGAIIPLTAGFKGEDSSFASIVAVGGGAGTAGASTGGDGGSGGGGGYLCTGGSNAINQGFPGGSSSGGGWGGTGGGGAGQPGYTKNGNNGGNGGAGLSSSISGASVIYAGGGGGGVGYNGVLDGSGGAGGGGNGSHTTVAGAGSDGLGGGGGAGGNNGTGGIGARGGSGIVIVRYTTP